MIMDKFNELFKSIMKEGSNDTKYTKAAKELKKLIDKGELFDRATYKISQKFRIPEDKLISSYNEIK